MDIRDFLPRIQAAGFTLEADGADIVVRPFSRLSEPQRAFIKARKPAILAALAEKATASREPDPDPMAAWNRVHELIHQGWAADFGPPDTEGRQAARWTPPDHSSPRG